MKVKSSSILSEVSLRDQLDRDNITGVPVCITYTWQNCTYDIRGLRENLPTAMKNVENGPKREREREKHWESHAIILTLLSVHESRSVTFDLKVGSSVSHMYHIILHHHRRMIRRAQKSRRVDHVDPKVPGSSSHICIINFPLPSCWRKYRCRKERRFIHIYELHQFRAVCCLFILGTYRIQSSMYLY